MIKNKSLLFLSLFLLTVTIICPQAVKRDPDKAREHLARGIDLVARSGNLFEDALKQYTLAIQYDPDLAEAYYRRAEVKMGIHNSTGIMEDFDKAIELKPDYVKAYLGRAYLKKQQKDFDGALADYGKCIELDPGFYRAYKLRGLLRFQLKRTDDAVADYTEAIRLKPDVADGYYLRGTALFKSGQYEAALPDLNRSLELDKDPIARYYRGVIHYHLGKYHAAIEDLDYSPGAGMPENHLGSQEQAHLFYIRGMAKVHLKFPRSGCRDLKKAAKLKYEQAIIAVEKYCSRK